MRFVGVPVPSSFDYVSHVVGLGSAFEVVWVAADPVVASVSDDGGPAEGGEVVGDAVGGPVFAADVELTVGVASSGACPHPTFVGVRDQDSGPKSVGVLIQEHVASPSPRLTET